MTSAMKFLVLDSFTVGPAGGAAGALPVRIAILILPFDL